MFTYSYEELMLFIRSTAIAVSTVNGDTDENWVDYVSDACDYLERAGYDFSMVEGE